MRDAHDPNVQNARTPFRVKLFLAMTFGLPLLPPLLVQNSTTTSRVTWYSWLGLICIAGLIGAAVYRYIPSTLGRSSDQKQSVAWKPGGHWYTTTLFWSFAAVVLLSIVFANLEDLHGRTTAAARAIADATEYVFPWISNFRRARSEWVISDLQALKIEAIQSIWFVYGLVTSIALIIRMYTISDDERRENEEIERRFHMNKTERSGFVALFMVSFSILISCMAFFGWGDFDATRSRKGCLLNARCYFQDDLAVIAAAVMKSGILFGFAFGAILPVRDFLRQRY